MTNQWLVGGEAHRTFPLYQWHSKVFCGSGSHFSAAAAGVSDPKALLFYNKVSQI
jgi:hypothetical protein